MLSIYCRKIVQYYKDFLLLYSRIEHTRLRDPDLKFPSTSVPVGKIGYEDAPVFIILCGDRRTKKAYPLFLDRSAENWPVISISAGVRGIQILIPPADLARTADATLCDIAKSS